MSNQINVLLTGAGFTANFGSPLARQIYNILLNAAQVQHNEEIRELFLLDENIKNSNYEAIYEQILSSVPNEDLKREFDNLLWTTFLNKVDFFSKTPQWVNYSGIKSQDYLLENFFIKFICSKNKSIFFSLNQDLFIERQCSKLFKEYQPDNNHIKSKLNGMKMVEHPVRHLQRLGVDDAITTRNVHAPLEGDLIQHISESNKENAKVDLEKWMNEDIPYTYYLKFHGSLDYSYEKRRLFITGENKSGRIASCPLTQFYSEKFEQVLLEYPCKLIIIGYGFQDEHINKIISNFLTKSSEYDEIHVVDKMNLQNFMEKVSDRVDSKNLKSKLKSYHPDGLDVRTLASFLEPNLLGLE